MTITFNDPLDTGEYNLLRSGHYEGEQDVSFFSGRIVFAGVVDEDLSLQTTWLQFAYTGVMIGDYTDVEVNQSIVIGTTNDLLYSAKVERLWRGRIRLAPDASFVYTNISSANVPQGAYYWVTDFWEPEGVLSRPSTFDAATAIQLVDSTLTYQPLLPRITGLRTMYVGYADTITGKLRIALDVTGHVEEFGTTISSYLFAFRAGIATVISGSLFSPTVTVDIDPTACTVWGETWATLTVTQSDGAVLTRVFGIKVHNSSHLPDTGFKNMQVKGAYDASQNYTATLPAFAGVNNILPGTPAIIWRSHEVYGSTSGSLTSDNIDFVGWFQGETGAIKGDATYSTLSESTFQLAGVGERMAYFAMQLLIIINDSAPTLWDHMISANPRRAVWHIISRHSTAAVLCDVAFDTDLSTESFVFPYLPLSGKNLLDIPNAVLAQVNAALEFAPDGRMLACRDAQYLDDTGQAAVPIIAAWDGQDGFVVAATANYDDSIGYVDADGAVWDTGQTNVTAFAARAPGIAQGAAQGSSQLSNQILTLGSEPNTAQAELNQRAGTFYAVSNLVEELTVDHPDGYNFIIPSRCQFYTWTLDAELLGANNVQRIIYTTDIVWFAKSVTFTHDNEKGTRKVRVVYRRVVFDAPPADTVPLPPPIDNTIPPLPPIPFPDFPDLPPFPDIGLTLPQLPPNALKPPAGKITGKTGMTVIESDANNAYVTQSFVALTTPQWAGVTPTDLGAFKIKQVLFDPLGPATNTCGAYILASDGTSSAVWWTANVLQRPPLWTKGDEVAGVYDIIRGTKTTGSILIHSPADATASRTATVTFDADSYPYTILDGTITTGGNPNNCLWGTAASGGPEAISKVRLNFASPVTVTAAQNDYKKDNFGNCHRFITMYDSLGTLLFSADEQSTPPNNTWVSQSWTTGTVAGVSYIDFENENNAGITTLNVYLDNCQVTYTSLAGGDGAARYSANDGATFGSPLSTGTSAGAVSGFDVQSAGSVSYAAADGKVRKATSLGGSYSDWYTTPGGNPVCLIIPYFKRNSTTVRNTTTSTPDVIAVCDDGVVLWIDGATATATTITPPGITGADNANCLTVAYGTHLALFATASGAYHLETSTNGGTSWTDKISLTSPHWIRGRRGDTTARLGAAHGQLYAGIDDKIVYSSIWDNSGGMKPRTIPNSASSSGDIYG